MSEFAIKDSGERQSFDSGMVRDVTEGKTDYSLILDGPMFDRWAEHLTKGAQKYDKRNWMQASGQAELERFRESALRHFIQWFRGDTDEDHAAAVMFNINGAEYVKARRFESLKRLAERIVPPRKAREQDAGLEPTPSRRCFSLLCKHEWPHSHPDTRS